MTNTQIEEERTPDELMEGFRGSSLKSIIVFTVVVHVILLAGTSGPYLWKSVMGEDNSKASEDQRIESAMREARAAVQEIAMEYQVAPQDLSSRFGGAVRRAPATDPAKPTDDKTKTETEPEAQAGTETEEPKSSIEKEIEVKASGPALPGVEEDDLFK